MYDVIKYSLMETFSLSILNRVTRHGVKAFALTVAQKLVSFLHVLYGCVSVCVSVSYFFRPCIYIHFNFIFKPPISTKVTVDTNDDNGRMLKIGKSASSSIYIADFARKKLSHLFSMLFNFAFDPLRCRPHLIGADIN